MPQIVELQDQMDGVIFGSGRSKYRGPSPRYPFKSFQVLGGFQIFFSICLLVLAFVHITLTEEDRGYFLLAGGIVAWAPLFGLSAGIVGVSVSPKRYWEVECLRIASIVTGVFSFVSHVALVVLVVLIESWYYGLLPEEIDPAEQFAELGTGYNEMEDSSEADGYLAFLGLIWGVSGLQVLVSAISTSLAMCCADTFSPDSEQVIVKQVGNDMPLPRKALPALESPFATQIGQSIAYDNGMPMMEAPYQPEMAPQEPQEYTYVEKPYLFDPATNTATPLDSVPQVLSPGMPQQPIVGGYGSLGSLYQPSPSLAYLPQPQGPYRF